MSYLSRLALALACSAVLLAQAGAQACSCPKEQLIKKYGTVSQLQHPQLPLPPPLPPSKARAAVPSSG